jgi:hypothetical protein
MTSVAVTWILLVTSLFFATSANAAQACDVMDLSLCSANGDGIQTGMTQTVLDRAKTGLDLQTGEPDKRVFEYTSTTACQFSIPGEPGADNPCMGAIQACAGNAPQDGQGPQVRLYRRELDATGAAIEEWQLVGTTCFPELVPGEPVLGMSLIIAAFNNTMFAKPAVHVQPEGNVTLVTLSTYFEVKWLTAGYQPGEIDTVTLMGSQVRIRPNSQGYTYSFGDGSSSGITPSPGGQYPTGDITHSYLKPGAYKSHIDITYGGEFSVSGGEWFPINDTALVPGPDQTVTVRTARAHLVIN